MTVTAGVMRRPRFITSEQSWNSNLVSVLEEMFMPIDWRTSVTSDYLAYQFYDSIQAIFSSVSGMLASRETLVSLGVSDGDASVSSALFLEVGSQATSRILSIIFSWRVSATMDAECKRFRFLADVFNDTSLILSTVSSAIAWFPGRAVILILAASLRALCGVCAGPSKAALTNHFARKQESVADINAKDASQETIIYLLGLLFGSLVVPYVTSTKGIWTWLLVLISLHLWANYQAVRHVHLTSLNRHRLLIVLAAWIRDRTQPLATPQEVAGSESILLTANWLDVHWLTQSNMSSLVPTTPEYYSDGKVAVYRGTHGVFFIALRQDATHLDLIDGLSNLVQFSAAQTPMMEIRDKLSHAGWDLDRDALCYTGLRYTLDDKTD